jgi:hypothetical protein
VAVKDVAWSMAIRFERRLARSLGGGPVWIVGDAAHVAPPVAVQSMNRGLVEAKTWPSSWRRSCAPGPAASAWRPGPGPPLRARGPARRLGEGRPGGLAVREGVGPGSSARACPCPGRTGRSSGAGGALHLAATQPGRAAARLPARLPPAAGVLDAGLRSLEERAP